MQREITSVKARGGKISGRVILVLILSSVGAIIALAACWAFLFGR